MNASDQTRDAPGDGDAVLEVSNLSVTYMSAAGTVHAVRSCGFEIRRREIFGVLGESGSGKSTVALAILGLLPPGAGLGAGASIRLMGQELTTLSERDLSRLRGSRMAMVFQDPKASLDPVMRVGHQIEEALRSRSRKTGRPASEEVEELLRQVQMPDPRRRMHDYAHQMSGGMRQRAMLAAALAGDPVLLVADEPTTALDLTIEAQIIKLLKRLKDDRGLAVLLITHDLRVMAEVATRAAVMHDGVIVETGEMSDLVERPSHPYTRALIDAATRTGFAASGRERGAAPKGDSNAAN